MADVTRAELTDVPDHHPGIEAAVVAIGAAAGATLRWLAGEVTDIDTEVGDFPWMTLTVNIVGCLLIGVAVARLRGLARVGVTTGLLGGFTTMSTFAVESNQLADAGETGLAVAYVMSSLALGVGAALIGRRLGNGAAVTEPAP